MKALALVILCILIPCLPAGSIEIDGVLAPGEWSEAVKIGQLHIAGQPAKPILADVYMVWANGYRMLVVAREPYHINTCDPADEYWTLFDSEKKEIKIKSFVGQDGCTAQAMEVAMVGGPGQHYVNLHTNFGEETGRMPRAAHIDSQCEPTAVRGPVRVEVVSLGEVSVVISEWSNIHFPPMVSVYDLDGVYEGEAVCSFLHCFYVDYQPSVGYYLDEGAERFGPFYAEILQVPAGLEVGE